MKNDNILNKVLITLGIVLAVLVLFFISENIGDRSNDKSSDNVKPVPQNEGEVHQYPNENESSDQENPLISEKWDSKEQKEVKKISFSTFKNKLKEDKVSVIMLATDSCYWCLNQKPVLEHFYYLNPEVNISALDLSNLSQDDFAELIKLNKELERIGTPTFLSIKNGKIEKIDSGAKNLDGLSDMFKTMGAM